MSKQVLKRFIYESIISEALGKSQQIELSDADIEYVNSVAPTEAPKTAIFGNYAFPKQRKSNPNEQEAEPNLPDEEDTEDEIAFEKALFKHVFDNQPFEPVYTDMIKNVLNSRFYKKVFRNPDPSESFYRGFSTSTRSLKKYLGLGKNGKISSLKGSESINYLWSPKGDSNSASSWTTDFDTASRFSIQSNLDRPWRVIVKAAPGQEKNFLAMYPKKDDPKSGLYRIMGGRANQFKVEREVVALGPVQIDQIWWIITPYDAQNQYQNIDIPKGVDPLKVISDHGKSAFVKEKHGYVW